MRTGPVWQLWINDEVHEQGALAFDLRHVLCALGSEALQLTWTVAGVGEWKGALSYGTGTELSYDEEVMATGEGGTELEAIARTRTKISGGQLLKISERTTQVIWGEFSGFRPDDHSLPWIRIIAIDSSRFEVLCEDQALLERVASAFSDTTLTSPPITLLQK